MSKKEKIELLLVGFHEFFYNGLKLFLKKHQNIELISYANTTAKILRLLKEHVPDVVMIDIDSVEQDSTEVSLVIKKIHPSTAILTFCAACEEQQILSMLEAGAKGVLFKNSPKEELVKAIDTVVAKKAYYCSTTSRKLLDIVTKRFDPKTNLAPRFTKKELEIIKLLCKEYTNKEIADKLSLSQRTVEDYRTSILKKIGAKNAVGVAVYAIRNHLVQ